MILKFWKKPTPSFGVYEKKWLIDMNFLLEGKFTRNHLLIYQEESVIADYHNLTRQLSILKAQLKLLGFLDKTMERN